MKTSVLLFLFFCGRAYCQGSLKPVFSEALGWGVVIGFGGLMMLLTLAMSWIDKRFFEAKSGVEATYTAGRNVSLGLTATVIVSQATWAATILQSSKMAWVVGVSGSYWYASSATVVLVGFAAISIEVKRKAPNMHTFCEFLRVRHDPGVRGETPQKFHHLTYVFFGTLTSIIVTALVILGGAATIHHMTGIPLEAAAFLLPVSVIAYTVVGGLKATFFAAYLHTGIVFIILWGLCLHTYAVSDEIGSAPVMYKLLERASALEPDKDGIIWSNYPPDAEPHQIQGTEHLALNAGNSYLTMRSDVGIIFGMHQIIFSLCGLFLDQSYYQSAIAARPSVAVSGFLVGGLVWWAIPFAMSTTFGLAARALQIPITTTEADAGLVPAIVTVELLGKGAGVGLLTMLFMAITSTGSAELIAVSSLLTYDIFLEYIPYGKQIKLTLEDNGEEKYMAENLCGIYQNSPENLLHEKTSRKLLTITRIFTFVFGILMGCIALILNSFGITLSWAFFVMTVLISGAVVPVCSSYFWTKARNWPCSLGCWFGLAMGVMSWLLFAWNKYNVVARDPLGDPEVCFYASLVAIGASSVVSIGGSLIFPDDFDWGYTLTKITRTDESAQEELSAKEKDPKFLSKEAKKARIVIAVIFFILIVIWPMPMFGTGYIFSEEFFTFWVAVSLGCSIAGGAYVILFPIWECIARQRIAKQRRYVTSNSSLADLTKYDLEMEARFPRQRERMAITAVVAEDYKSDNSSSSAHE